MVRIAGSRAHLPRTLQRRASHELVSENERRVLNLIRLGKAQTRSDLTRLTRLSAQAVSNIVDGLRSRGFVYFNGTRQAGRGQPGVLLHLRQDAAFAIGLHIMTDAAVATVMNFAGQVVGERYRTLCDPDDILNDIDALIEDVGTGLIDSPNLVVGLGVAMTGYFIGEGSQMNPPETLEALALRPVDEILSDRYKLPVLIENDGNAAAVGEALCGIGRECQNFAYLFVADGLGGGVIVNGELLRGSHGNAGEFSAMLDPDRSARRPNMALLRTKLAQHGVELASVATMLETFEPDWPGIDDWLDEVRPQLGTIASAIAAVVDPDYVVVGGRLPKALAGRLIEGVELVHAFNPRRGKPLPSPRLVISSIDGDAASIGAAAMMLRHYFFARPAADDDDDIL